MVTQGYSLLMEVPPSWWLSWGASLLLDYCESFFYIDRMDF